MTATTINVQCGKVYIDHWYDYYYYIDQPSVPRHVRNKGFLETVRKLSTLVLLFPMLNTNPVVINVIMFFTHPNTDQKANSVKSNSEHNLLLGITPLVRTCFCIRRDNAISIVRKLQKRRRVMSGIGNNRKLQ